MNTKPVQVIDQELEDAAKKAYPINNLIRDSAKQVMLKKAFKAGANWKAEQSANDVVEFAKWIIENYWSLDNKGMWYDRTKVHAGQQYDQSLTSQQLYELWQENQKRSMMS